MKRQSVLLLAVVFLTPFFSQAVERTSVAGAKVQLDDSILREAVEGAKYIIRKISPFAVIVFISLFILILIVEFILRLFRR